jgi:galactosyl transferase GMA12/MNN10 family
MVEIPKFKLVMFATADIAEYATLAAEINRRYCARHGYAFSFEQYDNVALQPPYEKVRVLQRHLWSAEYVLWVDADACVVNFSQRLEHFCDNGNDFVIAGHEFGFDLQGQRRRFEINGLPCGVNTGVMMFRSSEWTERFLRLWWDECFEGAQNCTALHEQGRLQNLLNINSLEIHSHTNVVLPSSRFNRGDGSHENVCEFVLHLWGTGAEHRKRILAAIANQQIAPEGITIPNFDVR